MEQENRHYWKIKKTYPQHLLNADVVFRDVMNENPDNDYSKSTARYLYSLYMRWGKKELAEQYKKILISTH